MFPLNPIDIALRGEYYTSSCGSHESSLKFNVTEEIQNGSWESIFPTPDSQVEAVTIISSNTILKNKMKQALSDSCSTRKRSARDLLFIKLQYHRLISRYQTADEGESSAKIVDVEVAKEKLRKKIPGTEDFDFTWWRSAPLKDVIRRPVILEENSIVPVLNKTPLKNIILFRDEDVLKVFHTFIGYLPNRDERQVETSIMAFARLDAWINCVVELLDTNDTRGGGRQRLYGDCFHTMLGLATKQLIGTFYKYVEIWNGEELKSPIVGDGYSTRKEHFFSLKREATIIVQSPSTQEYFIAISDPWFQKYITKDMGNVHDCYIASVSSDFREIKCLGTLISSYTVTQMEAASLSYTSDDLDSEASLEGGD